MAVEAPLSPLNNPLERLGRTVKAVPAWAGRHWKSLSLAVTALGGGGYLLINHDLNPASATNNNEVSLSSSEPPMDNALPQSDPNPKSLGPTSVSTTEPTPHPIPTLVAVGGLNTFEGFPPRLRVIAEKPNPTPQETNTFNLVYGDPIKIDSSSYRLPTNIKAVLKQEATKFLGDLYEEGLPPEQIQFFIVDANSPGVLVKIYQDLASRGLGATTVEDYPGLKEAFNTPFLLFMTPNLTLTSSPKFLSNLLIHEFRHIRQAIGNPNLQEDFRNPDGSFTTYAAFMEAWADEGLCTTPKYQSCTLRMPTLRQTLKSYQTTNKLTADSDRLIDMAGNGDKTAYNMLAEWFAAAKGSTSFSRLFPSFW